MSRELNPFLEDDMSEALVLGLDAVFAEVTEAVEKRFGPISQFTYQDCYDPATGKYLGATHDRKPICDERREWGGMLDRYFDAHWGLRRAADMLDIWVSSLIQNAILYGWSLSLLEMNGIIKQRLVSPIDYVIVIGESAIAAVPSTRTPGQSRAPM